jgi:hypothetical protein
VHRCESNKATKRNKMQRFAANRSVTKFLHEASVLQRKADFEGNEGYGRAWRWRTTRQESRN